MLGCQNTFLLCYTHHCTQYTHLNMFQASARATETFHVLPFIATGLFPYHMFGLPFPLNCFHSTSYVCIVCAFPGCAKIIPCNFNSTCLCSNTQLWLLLWVCSRKNNGSEDIFVNGRCVKLYWTQSVEWHFITWEILAHVHTFILILSQQLYMHFSTPTYRLLNSLDNQINLSACQQNHGEWFIVSRKFLHWILIVICFRHWRMCVAFGIVSGLHLLDLENPLCIVFSIKLLWVLQRFPHHSPYINVTFMQKSSCFNSGIFWVNTLINLTTLSVP